MSIFLPSDAEIQLFHALKNIDFSSLTNYIPNGDSQNLVQWDFSTKNASVFEATSIYRTDIGDVERDIQITIHVDFQSNKLNIISIEPVPLQDTHTSNWS